MEFIKGWPNTYTFTKSMAERALDICKKPKTRVVVVRPCIIACSAEQPYPGWTDTLSASGGLNIGVGMGLINTIYGTDDNTPEVIPVDYVSNACIMATALYGKMSIPKVKIIHMTSVHVNPITLR